MKNLEVAKAWRASAKGKSRHMETDGEVIWSYDLCIGATYKGRKVARDFTAGAKAFVSMTTSCHCCCAKSVAHSVVSPPPRQWYAWLQQVLLETEIGGSHD